MPITVTEIEAEDLAFVKLRANHSHTCVGVI